MIIEGFAFKNITYSETNIKTRKYRVAAQLKRTLLAKKTLNVFCMNSGQSN